MGVNFSSLKLWAGCIKYFVDVNQLQGLSRDVSVLLVVFDFYQSLMEKYHAFTLKDFLFCDSNDRTYHHLFDSFKNEVNRELFDRNFSVNKKSFRRFLISLNRDVASYLTHLLVKVIVVELFYLNGQQMRWIYDTNDSFDNVDQLNYEVEHLPKLDNFLRKDIEKCCQGVLEPSTVAFYVHPEHIEIEKYENALIFMLRVPFRFVDIREDLNFRFV